MVEAETEGRESKFRTPQGWRLSIVPDARDYPLVSESGSVGRFVRSYCTSIAKKPVSLRALLAQSIFVKKGAMSIIFGNINEQILTQ